jgi:hypothetical protein
MEPLRTPRESGQVAALAVLFMAVLLGMCAAVVDVGGYSGYMTLGWYYSDPGAKFNSSQVKDAVDARLSSVMLFPVYRDTRGSGAGFEYQIVGWAGYVVTRYEIKGSKNNKLFGYFTSITWEGIMSETAGSPNFGAHAVALVE